MRQLEPGDRVKLTGQFLRSTGQATGGEGRKVWTVVSCTCGLCKRETHVAVDEFMPFEDDDGNPMRRHFHQENLYRKRTLTVRNT